MLGLQRGVRAPLGTAIASDRVKFSALSGIIVVHCDSKKKGKRYGYPFDKTD